jgi:hypothetical protein
MPFPFKKAKKKNLKETIKYQKIAWQNPLEIAQKVSQNYHKNWVFLFIVGFYWRTMIEMIILVISLWHNAKLAQCVFNLMGC